MREELWLLRWRFDYSDGKPHRFGQWNRPGNHANDFAWAQTKKNLATASIEGKNYRTYEKKILAQVPGHEFLNFQWVAGTMIPLKAKDLVIRSPDYLFGMRIITPKTCYSQYVNGHREECPTPPGFLQIQFAGLGR